MNYNQILEKVILPIRIAKFRLKIFKIKLKNPELFKPVNTKIEKEHILLWKQLFPIVDVSWFRFYSNISRKTNPNYVPEDLFYSIIERKLNDVNYSNKINDKNSYDIRFDANLFPEFILKNKSNSFLNSKNEIITKNQAKKIFEGINEDIIIKPTLDSGGGKNVILLKKENEKNFDDIIKKYDKNFIIQKKINQHKFFSQFNPSSLNTLRIFVYRSIKNEKTIILKTVLRIGKKGVHVDNQRVGGISIEITNTGILNNYAVSKFGKKFFKHPDSKIKFKNQKIINFKKIQTIVLQIANQIPSHKLLSFDVCVTNNNKIKVIEINTTGVEINFLQSNGSSLFENYSQEIIDYCKNKNTDEFEYFRTTL